MSIHFEFILYMYRVESNFLLHVDIQVSHVICWRLSFPPLNGLDSLLKIIWPYMLEGYFRTSRTWAVHWELNRMSRKQWGGSWYMGAPQPVNGDRWEKAWWFQHHRETRLWEKLGCWAVGGFNQGEVKWWIHLNSRWLIGNSSLG